MAIQHVWHIEVLNRSSEVSYFDGAGLSADRDDALEYTDVDEAAEDYIKLASAGFDASIEVSQRVLRLPGHNSASRLERWYLNNVAAE